MDDINSPVSLLLSGVMMECFNSKELRSQMDDYARTQANDGKLSAEREKWLSETEKCIDKMKGSKLSQLRPLIKHQPIEVQYFIFERLAVLLQAAGANPDYASLLDIDAQPAGKIARVLRDAWASNQKRVLDSGLNFDTYVHQIFQQN